MSDLVQTYDILVPKYCVVIFRLDLPEIKKGHINKNHLATSILTVMHNEHQNNYDILTIPILFLR